MPLPPSMAPVGQPGPWAAGGPGRRIGIELVRDVILVVLAALAVLAGLPLLLELASRPFHGG